MISSDKRTEINARLAEMAAEERVRVLYACDIPRLEGIAMPFRPAQNLTSTSSLDSSASALVSANLAHLFGPMKSKCRGAGETS